ncbi:MAG: glycoside hydrolase family 15 protein [Alphaproteobacteria bacterium]
MNSLGLGIIGNCAFSALIDDCARVQWMCLPRFDGDPVFHGLLNGDDIAPEDQDGIFSIVLEDFDHAEQAYAENTAVLKTVLYDRHGQSLEITDVAPRFPARGRMFRPLVLLRRVRPLRGRPRIRVHLRPQFEYGTARATITHGSNHIRYVNSGTVLRLTTNAPVTYVLDEKFFFLDQPFSLVLGPDETLTEGVEETARDFEERTVDYWRTWCRRLAIPYEWQAAVIRAAITLKLCTFEETGAIVAAMTTSVPEAENSGRNWDYRYCWLRDAFFVIRALNSLSEMETMENYLRYLTNIVGSSENGHLQPVYGIGLESRLDERIVPNLQGYRGQGPVRAGNQAYEHFQYDVYGNVILGAAQSFFDSRLFRKGSVDDFHLLEEAGEQAFRLFDQPDAGMWEFRTMARVHTSSSVMCWAACDRLSLIARQLGVTDRANLWAERADKIKTVVMERAWNEDLSSFVTSFEGSDLDAGLLLMTEVGFLKPSHPKFLATVERIEKTLLKGKHMFRYAARDDFGLPETAFNICTFWYIDALARLERFDEAREIFESMLSCRNHLGLLSEDVHPDTGELWGNFPQTYSMVGVINGAVRLSRRWESVL